MRISGAVRYALFLVVAACLSNSANAGVIVALLLNQSSTAGGGATSTRSGNGSWHIYALDDSDTDFGISSYNIVMSGTTAIGHRSPVTTINDGSGDGQTAGFNLLRTGTNLNPIQGSQGLPGTTPFLITGFGQTASDFITKSTAIDAAAVTVGPTTSGVWGSYSSPDLTAAAISASTYPPAAKAATVAALNAGKKWVFLAEGLGPAGVTQVTSAVFTVFTTQDGQSGATPVTILGNAPEPSSGVLLLTGLVGFIFTTRRRWLR